MSLPRESPLLVWTRRGVSTVIGLGLGLFMSRVVMEGLALDWSWPLFLVLTLPLAAAGIYLARGRAARLLPLALLYAYLLYPHINLRLASNIAFIALVATFFTRLKSRRAFIYDTVVFIVAMVIYLYTLAPTILPADSGEFQFVAYVLGIAHPPGYPLYTMLGKLFTYLPVGDIAYRMNLMSAFFAALTLALVGRYVRSLTGSAFAGLMAALSLGALPTFWAQATTANIRSLVALFTASLLALTCGQGHLPWFLLAFTFGLGATHHGSLAFLALPFGLFLLAARREWWEGKRAALKVSVGLLLSLSVLLYLPIGSLRGAYLDPGHLHTWRGFLDHILARGFRGDMFYFAKLSLLPKRLSLLGAILVMEFGFPFLLLVAWGALAMLFRQAKFFLLVGGVFLVNAFTGITYRSPQTVEYLMPSYVALAVFIGYGVFALMGLGHLPSLKAIIAALAILLSSGNLWRSYPSFAWLSWDSSVRHYAESLLREAPPNTSILANWHYSTPLWYLQLCEGVRPDVEVKYVYPQGATPMPLVWQRRIEEEIGKRSVIVTNRKGPSQFPYRLLPLADGFLVQKEPLFSPPEGITGVSAIFGDKIELFGYELERREVLPGGHLTLLIYWRPVVKLDRAYSFFTHIIEPGGRILGQRDITHQPADYQVGEILVDRYTIPVSLTAAPARHELIAGVYITPPEGGWQRLKTRDGLDAVSLGKVTVKDMITPPVTAHPLYRPFEGGVVLVGADPDVGFPQEGQIYLHWYRAQERKSLYEVVLYAGGKEITRGQIAHGAARTYITTVHDVLVGPRLLELELRTATGAPVTPLGAWRRPRRGRLILPPVSIDSRFVPFGDEIALTGLSFPEKPGQGCLEVELDFLALKPILRDYTVSVQLREMEGRWEVQHNSTPAWGAIPTLKWIRGMRISDRHTIIIPQEAMGEAAILRLVIYDSFTLEKLGHSVELARIEGPFHQQRDVSINSNELIEDEAVVAEGEDFSTGGG